MISRLSPTKYPVADPSKYIVALQNVDMLGVDPIFLGRLAAWAKYKGKILSLNSGYRSIAKQHDLFIAQGGKFDAIHGYYWPATIPAAKRTVAKPGNSYHNYRLAIDTNSIWAKLVDKEAAASMQNELLKFGIFKPMTKGNGMSVLEDWHIQPIETLNQSLAQRKDLTPFDDTVTPKVVLKRGMKGDEVAILQSRLNKFAYKLVIDFDFSMVTEGAVRDFQKSHNLTADGIVGNATWTQLFK